MLSRKQGEYIVSGGLRCDKLSVPAQVTIEYFDLDTTSRFGWLA